VALPRSNSHRRHQGEELTLKANSDTGSGLDGQYVSSPSEWVRTQVADYEASGGVEGAPLEGRPVVILTSVGAKSGKVRKNPVMRIVDGDHPTVRLQDGASVREFQAREVSGEEKRYYYLVAERFWPHFPEYRRLGRRPRHPDHGAPADCTDTSRHRRRRADLIRCRP
jgi:hypothetical protein